ncbi:MAG: tyrosine-type recombinase/integrase [bacterium]|nr:tyrosine-type recombinase/integrase [bacterium]
MRAKARERFRKRKDGTRVSEGWFVFVYEGNRTKGRKVKDQATAEAIAAQLNQEGEAADRWFEGGPMPLDETMRGWITIHGKTMADSTEETHRNSIETHLIPYFGSREIRGITREDLIEFIDDRFRAKKSAATIKNALSALRRVYSLHVEAGLLDRNPAINCGQLVAQIERKYVEEGVREVDAWTRDEVEQLLAKARDRERFVYPVLFAALCTGMRRGELLALRWEDVGREEIRIRRALVRGRIKAPKSGKPRTVALSSDFRALLDEWRASRKKREGAFSEPGWVFTNANGDQWEEKNFGRSWRRLRTRCVDDQGEPTIRPLAFHATRHTFASWALDAGKSITWVQHALGHSDPATTLRRYAHFVPEETPDMGFLRLVHPTESRPSPTERSADAS